MSEVYQLSKHLTKSTNSSKTFFLPDIRSFLHRITYIMEAPQAKKVKSSETPVDGKLNERYLTPDIMESVKAQYNSEPLFRHAILPDFFDNDFFENVKAELFKELNEEDWTPLNNDLYTFIQSNDLKHSEEVCS